MSENKILSAPGTKKEAQRYSSLPGLKKRMSENKILSAPGTKKGALCFFDIIKQEISNTKKHKEKASI